MNEQLQAYARGKIKDGLEKLPKDWQFRFKRMYSPNNLEGDMNSIVDSISEDKLDWAMQQVERSLIKLRSISTQ